MIEDSDPSGFAISTIGLATPRLQITERSKERVRRVISLASGGTSTITNDGTIELKAISPYNLAIFAGISSCQLDNRHGTIIGLVDLSDGNDTFLGGAGDERITDGRGDDFIDGAGGNDTLVCALVGSSTPLTIDLSITTAQATVRGTTS